MFRAPLYFPTPEYEVKNLTIFATTCLFALLLARQPAAQSCDGTKTSPTFPCEGCTITILASITSDGAVCKGCKAIYTTEILCPEVPSTSFESVSQVISCNRNQEKRWACPTVAGLIGVLQFNCNACQ
jgi:hypothetical protein